MTLHPISKLSAAVFTLLFWSGLASALPMPFQVRSGRISPPVQAGVVTGGKADLEFTLINVRAQKLSENSERLIFEYGDRRGQPVNGEPGYFHASIDRGGKRITLDLAQVQRTAVDPKTLSRILAFSNLVASSEMTMDPQDLSTNITLHLKSSATMKVGATSGRNGRLIVEIHKASGVRK